jgi:hypothetical protein
VQFTSLPNAPDKDTYARSAKVIWQEVNYITLVVGHVVTALHAKKLASISRLDFAAGMITDENILMS